MKGIVDFAGSGLMQFELTHPGYRARAIEVLGSAVVWVHQPQSDQRGSLSCGVPHAKVWPIAMDLLPESEREREEAVMKANGGSRPVICTCAGRVIE